MMERQVRARAREEIARILESASFDVEPMDPPLDLSAIREDECVLVLCSDDEGEYAEFDRTVYRVRNEGRDVVCRKVLFSMNDRPAVNDCVLWGIPALVDYAGKAACARVLGREMVLDFAPPRPLQVLGRPGASPPPSGGVAQLPVRLTEREARQLANCEGAARLRLIPYWYVRYVSSGRTTYRDKAISFDEEGVIAMNAINGETADPEEEAVIQAELPQGAEVLEAQITRDGAAARAVEYVVGRLTQKVRIRQERREAIFYEEKIFRPDRRAIRVELSRVFVPVWQIRGRSIVEINAFSGETLSSPMDEGVEIL
ncbi:MAG: hypothetical protein ABFC89_03425 [Methanospirillum sp.]